MRVPDFEAAEVRAGGVIGTASYAYAAHDDGTWTVRRNGAPFLELGQGYRALRVSHAGICATDLARPHLPFPLPQVTGHEVVALTDDGMPVLVEINASHVARSLPRDEWCGRCVAGLDTHCRARLVLGIDRLVGGFAPWILAPAAALIPVPTGMDPLTAVLAEPFAAAWHAVTTIDPAEGASVAVLGTGRLGLLVVAALGAWRRATGRRIDVVAIARSAERGALARRLGADETVDAGAVARASKFSDIVIDTTGTPDGLLQAARLARSEVHLKSTTGRAAGGLAHATELVVDEISVDAWSLSNLPADAATAVVLAADSGDAVRSELARAGIQVLPADDLERVARQVVETQPLGGVDVAVVETAADVDRVVRPCPGSEQSIVRPRGRILLMRSVAPTDSVIGDLVAKPLRLSTSRCGRFAEALPALQAIDAALDEPLGQVLVTAVRCAAEIAAAQAEATRAETLKVVVAHPGGLVAPGVD